MEFLPLLLTSVSSSVFMVLIWLASYYLLIENAESKNFNSVKYAYTAFNTDDFSFLSDHLEDEGNDSEGDSDFYLIPDKITSVRPNSSTENYSNKGGILKSSDDNFSFSNSQKITKSVRFSQK